MPWELLSNSFPRCKLAPKTIKPWCQNTFIFGGHLRFGYFTRSRNQESKVKSSSSLLHQHCANALFPIWDSLPDLYLKGVVGFWQWPIQFYPFLDTLSYTVGLIKRIINPCTVSSVGSIYCLFKWAQNYCSLRSLSSLARVDWLWKNILIRTHIRSFLKGVSLRYNLVKEHTNQNTHQIFSWRCES